MEAVPKIPLISFERKESAENTHFAPKLKQYIQEIYREDAESYSNEIHQLESLRSAAVRASPDEEGLKNLTRYYCQLLSLKSRFQMIKGQIAAVSFSWKDCYAGVTTHLADIRFELACILYNIGALHTQLGASEPRTSAESLKAACTHYQQAAWAFTCVREQYTQPPGTDLASDVMKLMEEICLAQAQECILEKSIQDANKPSVIGAVATQVMMFYKNSITMIGPSSGADSIVDTFGSKIYHFYHRYLSFKLAYIGCIVCLYQGLHAEEQQKMGERVAFYQLAVDKLAEARKLMKYVEPVQITQEAIIFTNDVVEGKRKAAKNENEFIYHEEVPEKDMLTDLKPALLVKAIPINCKDPEVSGPDIFARLVPMNAHETSSLYSEEKAKLLRAIMSQVEARNTELTEFMSSLQLDQLEVVDSDQTIPQEIVDRCAAMNAKTEVIQSLVDSMNSLAEIISDVELSLGDIKNFIQEETMKEKEFQKLMGPRPPSIVQTELSREFHKYQEAHLRTNESNQVLHKAMTLHIANLRLLSQPLEVLQAKIPSIDNIEGLDRETMKEMRRVVGKVREMQSQRDSLVAQLREAVTSDDITQQLLTRGKEPAELIFKQELEKHTPKVKIIEQNLAAQENIINKLTSLYASYGESRRLLSDVMRKREGVINALITSFDTYEELLGKCQKGLEFYKKLSNNIGQLLSRLRSTCQVQEEERAQLLNKHTAKKVATPPPASPPPAGAHTTTIRVPAASTPPPSTQLPIQPPSSSGGPLKLKDYLPYMKNRAARSVTPQAQIDQFAPDTYYPETMYPPSVRPAPVGSEANDVPQMQLPDGVVMPPMQPPYNRYGAYTPPDTNYSAPYAYPTTSKAYDKPDDVYSTPYTPQQYSDQQSVEPQYANPYYSGSQNNPSGVSNTQSLPSGSNMNPSLNYNPYAPNAYSQGRQIAPIPESSSASYGTVAGQSDLASNFAQMQINQPKPDQPGPYTGEYNQTYFNVQYPQVSSPNMATYSNAPQSSHTNMVASQMPSDYNSLNYPYSTDQTVPNYSQGINPNTSTAYAMPNQPPTSLLNHYNATQVPQMNNQVSPAVNQVPQSMNQVPQAMNQVPQAMNQSPLHNQVPQGMAQEQQSTNQIPQAMNQVPQAMNQVPKPMNQVPQSMNQVPQSMKQVPQSMNQPPQAMNQVPQSMNQPPQAMNQVPNSYDSYENPSQMFGHTIYTNDSALASASNIVLPHANLAPQYTYQPEQNQSLAEMDDIDQPIKSHVTGEALSTHINYQPYTYNQPINPTDQNPPQTYNEPDQQTSQTPNLNTTQNFRATYALIDQTANMTYSQTFQNHPGYSYNVGTGGYDYHYGSQNAYLANNYEDSSHTSVEQQPNQMNTQWPTGGMYTSAGICDTLQSPSEAIPQQVVPEQQNNTENVYYNTPYGYVTNTNQSTEIAPTSITVSTNYGANVNQSTYMQSGQQNTNVTFTNNHNNQVSTPVENVSEPPNFDQNVYPDQNSGDGLARNPPVEPEQQVPEKIAPKEVESMPEIKPQPTTFDLLSDIDFTVEQKPLLPEIKVPQISESAIKKAPILPKSETVSKAVVKEEVIERPAKKDLFSDPALLNKFTEEVKNLQRLVDSLSSKSVGGLTVLDAKWKLYQEVQARENMTRSKSIATNYAERSVVAEVVPFDDSRLTLKSDPDAYINATYYKQLASWCIPLVVSRSPVDREHSVFWRAILENKIGCVVCLLSEIELQGKSYWPTAKGQTLEVDDDVKVTLEEVTCTVHWTERKLTVVKGKTALTVSHYQINVFPAKIVCTPLVLLADKILSQTYLNRLSNQLSGAWVQCARGAGRSAVMALLMMVMCQVRAGQLDLCEMLDAGCVNLCKHRTNVLEDTKYLADAYRTALFYVQGVLCSGTTMFNGEAVSVPTGAAVLPPIPTPPSTTPTTTNPIPINPKNKFSKESFEEMKQAPGLKSGDMKDPLNFLDPLWSLKKK